MIQHARIWVLGAEGLLGKDLCDTIGRHASGRPVQPIELLATGRKEANIRDGDALFARADDFCPTLIINCAAYTDVEGAEDDVENAHAVNCLGAENVAKVAKSINAGLVHLSTDFVFDGHSDHTYDESASVNPLNVYGRSKAAGERRVLDVLGDEAQIIRASWLFGTQGHDFVQTVVRLLQTQDSIRMVSDQIGRPTSSLDLSQAILALAGTIPVHGLCERRPGGIYHFANRGAVSRYDFARGILDHYKTITGADVRCQRMEAISDQDFPQKAKRPLRAILDTSRYATTVGRNPRDWRRALDEVLRIRLDPGAHEARRLSND